MYDKKEYNEFLRKTEFSIKCIEDKKRLKEIITHLQGMDAEGIEAVIEYAHEHGVCRKDDKLASFIEKSRYIYDQVKKLKFEEFQRLFAYLEGYTPFSTQHKIKGDEFDNVLVVLDNGGWNNYNFKSLFEQGGSKESIMRRTQKLFYVCCTRSKENLVVYYHNPSPTSLSTAMDWFGSENVIEI